MQLKKRHIRRTPTFCPVIRDHYGRVIDKGAPHGIHRRESDFCQVNNHAQENRNRFGDMFEKVYGMWVYKPAN